MSNNQSYRSGHVKRFRRDMFDLAVSIRDDAPALVRRVFARKARVYQPYVKPLAEGALPMHGPGTLNGEPAEIAVFDPLMAFSLAWDSINGKRAPWDSNPWVWALTFRVAV